MAIQQIEVLLHGPEGVQERKMFDVNDATAVDDAKKFVDGLDIHLPKGEQQAAAGRKTKTKK